MVERISLISLSEVDFKTISSTLFFQFISFFFLIKKTREKIPAGSRSILQSNVSETSKQVATKRLVKVHENHHASDVQTYNFK